MSGATPDIVHQVGVSAAKVAPPIVVTIYSLVSKGLPFVISVLTLAYLSFQIAHLLWSWRNEWVRKREIAELLKGRIAPYQEKAPK